MPQELAIAKISPNSVIESTEGEIFKFVECFCVFQRHKEPFTLIYQCVRIRDYKIFLFEGDETFLLLDDI